MPYLVDGHNLIPLLPGITLQDLEDEAALIGLLERFARRERARIEVFFDQAPPSKSGSRAFGRVKAHFIRQGTTADQAIVSRLGRLGGEARNWTVVTSDREILAEARSSHAKTLSSAAFAALLGGVEQAPGPEGGKDEHPRVSGEELDYWLDQFDQGPGEAG